MKLLLLLTLILGGFSLPAHASKQLDICADHKLTKSNRGSFIVRRLSDGRIREESGDRAAIEKLFKAYCSDR